MLCLLLVSFRCLGSRFFRRRFCFIFDVINIIELHRVLIFYHQKGFAAHDRISSLRQDFLLALGRVELELAAVGELELVAVGELELAAVGELELAALGARDAAGTWQSKETSF